MVLATSPTSCISMASAVPPSLLVREGYTKADLRPLSPAASPSFNRSPVSDPMSPSRGKLDFSPMSDAGESSPKSDATTLMIRNLPTTLTQHELRLALDNVGMSKLYDFCYLPRDFNCPENKGYAFVNFVSPEIAQLFRKSFHRHGFLAGQQTVISDAVVQGLHANLKPLATSAKKAESSGAGAPPG